MKIFNLGRYQSTTGLIVGGLTYRRGVHEPDARANTPLLLNQPLTSVARARTTIDS